MPEKKPKKPRAPGTVRKRRKPAGVSVGLGATELQAAKPPGEVIDLHQQIEADGGKKWITTSAEQIGEEES